MQSVLLAGLSASNECRKIVVELIRVSDHQPVGRALARNEKPSRRGGIFLWSKFAFALRERCG